MARPTPTHSDLRSGVLSRLRATSCWRAPRPLWRRCWQSLRVVRPRPARGRSERVMGPPIRSQGSRIIGTGGALPGQPVSNAQLVGRLAARGVQTSDTWIVERTGIRQRYLAEPGSTTGGLGVQAARAALLAAGVPADSIDLIVR